MMIYQVKIRIDKEIEQEWLQWMQEVHVPDMISTGLIKSCQILKPLENISSTYFFNYYFDSETDFEEYEKIHAPALRAHPKEMFPNKFEASRQLFSIV